MRYREQSLITKIALVMIVVFIGIYFLNPNFIPTGNVVDNIQYDNFKIEKIGTSGDYQTLKITFTMTNVNNERYSKFLDFKIETGKGYEYNRVCQDNYGLCQAPQMSGTLPEQKKNGEVLFSILANDTPAYLIVYEPISFDKALDDSRGFLQDMSKSLGKVSLRNVNFCVTVVGPGIYADSELCNPTK